MARDGPYPSFYVPDEGIPYLPGEVVRVDHTSGPARVVKDEYGDYEVIDCRLATELTDGPPMLRVNLRRLRRSRAHAGHDR